MRATIRTVDGLFSATSAGLSWLFAILTWRQYQSRRKLHQAVWAVGVAFFALGVTCEAVARAQGAWSEGNYRLWYVSGAMLGVAFLGQGTLHLLNREAWTRTALEVMVVLAVVAAVVVLNAPLNFARLEFASEPSGKAFLEIREAGWGTPRAWTIPFNTYGSLWLIGGALYSTVQLWGRNRARALGTLLIAVSGLMLASTSALNRFGISGLESLGRMVGVSVLFGGFLLTALEANQLPKLVWPRIPPNVLAWSFTALIALTVLFTLEPLALSVLLEYPGLFIIAGMVLGLFALVLAKLLAKTRETKGRNATP